MSILLGLAPFMPILLDFIGWIASAFGISQQNYQIYQDMIQKQNNAGLLSLTSHDRLLGHQAAIEARIKAKAALATKPTAGPNREV